VITLPVAGFRPLVADTKWSKVEGIGCRVKGKGRRAKGARLRAKGKGIGSKKA
jgi:hypothetical protein